MPLKPIDRTEQQAVDRFDLGDNWRALGPKLRSVVESVLAKFG